MIKIRDWFEKDTGKYEITEYEGILEARTETIIFMIIEPHDGIKNKWLLCTSTVSAFDRWANLTAQELFFDTDIELYNYLNNHQMDIYEDLIRYL